MAETVKKSRIVSDGNNSSNNENDNFSDAMLEEFDMMLKHCKSQDDLQMDDDDNDEKIVVGNDVLEKTTSDQIEYANILATSEKTSTKTFIQIEKENYYEEPNYPPIEIEKGNLSTNGEEVKTNGYNNTTSVENIYEPIIHSTNNISNPNEKTDDDNEKEIDNKLDQYIDMSCSSTTTTNTTTTKMLATSEEIQLFDEHIYENVAEEAIVSRPDLTLTDLSDDQQLAINNKSSVKDRMFLSTETAPCLLFTQTVTSPMLTPSEENIDFLKGFQQKAEEEAEEEKTQENVELVKDENIYENGEFLKSKATTNDERIYENIELMKNKENGIDKVEEVVEDVEIKNDENEVVEDKVKEIVDKDELKSVDIMKQINMFENEDSTQVTESYVETTTVESSSITDNNKSLKKKKSKKSRKEEKENISVNGTNNNNNNSINSNCSNINNNNNNDDSFFYNVNVKSLCRSFGDLTKIFDDNKAAIKLENNNNTMNNMKKIKTKQQTDVIRINRMKSSFSKFDALQKKNVLHVRSSDSSKAQEKFNGEHLVDNNSSNCRACDKAVYQMEQIKAEKAIWHKNCFRCNECNKQLNVDTYQSHEGTLYCKPHFKALFAPKAVEDDTPSKPRKPELIIRESQPIELPPDVVRASDKPDLGLEELQSLNVKERFQVFEQHQQQSIMESSSELHGVVNVKRSPSILSKLARFQAKGMDIGVTDDSLNGIPIEESSSENDDDDNNNDSDANADDELNGNEDADLIRAKRVQKEKPFHFTGMNDVKSRWEQGEQLQSSRDERREERKQEIQSIRNRLFMGKQGKMKEAYQQAVMESESCTNLKNKEVIEAGETKLLKERFEKGEVVGGGGSEKDEKEVDETEVYESEISKKSRSLFLELDANASKAPQIQPVAVPKLDVKKAREAYISKTSTSEDVVKSTIDQVENVEIRTADIQQRFKFFETYKEPEQEKRAFRITPPREGQTKAPTPDREVYRDPEVVRSEEVIEDSVVAKQSHTATKMLNKFRQMEEEVLAQKDQQPLGPPKPLKCFTPPPEPARVVDNSSGNNSEESSEDDEDSDDDDAELKRNGRGGNGDGEDQVDKKSMYRDEDLIEAQKAARAKQLRAKFERWEANEIKKEQTNSSSVNLIEEFGGDEQSQIESTKTLRARFESMRETTSETQAKAPKVKVNRFVEILSVSAETCESCNLRVYPLEKISVHNHIYHKNCFKCRECSCVLRMDSYSYNQGLVYCKPHFRQLFISKGNYDTGFGFGQHKEKWNTSTTAA